MMHANLLIINKPPANTLTLSDDPLIHVVREALVGCDVLFAGRSFFRLVVSLLDLLLLAVAEFLFLRAWLFVAAFLSLRLVWRFVVLVVLPDTNCTTGLLIGSLQVGEVTARMAPVGLALVLDPV